MSQIRAKNKNGLDVIFGLDHALGWYVTIFNLEGERFFDYDQVNVPGFGKSDLLDILERELEMDERLEYALRYIAMDLDPKDGIDAYEYHNRFVAGM